MNVNWGNLVGTSLETIWDCTVGLFTLTIIDVGADIAKGIMDLDRSISNTFY